MGYNAVDNGFLRFDHVRIPKDAMLMAHSKVLDDGTYIPPPVKKAVWDHGICSIRYRHERGFIHEKSRDNRVAI